MAEGKRKHGWKKAAAKMADKAPAMAEETVDRGMSARPDMPRPSRAERMYRHKSIRRG
jgi:hypothetical protein